MLSVLVTYILLLKRRETYEKNQTIETPIIKGVWKTPPYVLHFKHTYLRSNNMEACHDFNSFCTHSQMEILLMRLFPVIVQILLFIATIFPQVK